MNNTYKQLARGMKAVIVLAGLLLSGAASAQSGPVGNEWIVPGQQYYRVKILRNGLYKLNYQYLTQAGIAGVAPSQLQIWRRGRELATYKGGSTTVLDPTSFVEFYAIQNDGRLDRELYKRAEDQAHMLYSFYTDTASYFITWSVGAAARPGRAMAQPVTAAGTPHPYRLLNRVQVKANIYLDSPLSRLPDRQTFLPWLEGGEGFFGSGGTNTCDSLRNVSPVGPAPRVEVLLWGASNVRHVGKVQVVPPGGGTNRILGLLIFNGIQRARQTFQLQPSDISGTGTLTLSVTLDASSPPGDNFYVGYVRVVAPQANRWYARRNSVEFQNDSLLAGPATYAYHPDSIPATVAGFDVQDLYNVQRVVAATGGGQRQFVFPDANAGATHRLLLADEARPAVPPLPARRVQFRAINPAQPTFVIVTNPVLMKPAAGYPGVSSAAQEYADYRASAAGGNYNTLVITTAELYDQFQYGDRSWLALRHFARWLGAANPAGSTGSNRFLLLLGRGIVPSESGVNYRINGDRGLDLVPTSSRGVSENLITADYARNDYAPLLTTSRLAATTPVQVMNYLTKVKVHDAQLRAGIASEPWLKNVLHLVGGNKPEEFVEFGGYMDKYKRYVEKPLFGGKVVNTYARNTTNGTGQSLIVRINIANELNAGLAVINYFGHGSNTDFGLDIGYVDTGFGYANQDKYPVLLYNGCAAAHVYTSTNTFFDNWLFTPNKGAVGALGQYGLSYAYALDAAQDALSQLLFNDPAWYGKPIPAVYAEVVRRAQRNLVPGFSASDSTNAIVVEQLLCTNWDGDPTISLYAPAKPDFQVSDATVSVVPATPGGTVTAASPTFFLRIGVTNPGKVTTEPVEIRVTRTIPGVTQPIVSTQTFPQGPQGSATYDFPLTNPAGVNVFGTNTFRVEIDYLNKVDESDETNNTAQTTYTFLRGGVTVLSPVEFAIVGTDRPRLVVQTNDPLGPSRAFEFEADTSLTFNSGPAIRRVSGPLTATLVPTWQPTLPGTGRDSTVWYWRVRFQTPIGDEDPNWVVSSFRIIPNRTAGGWSQSHHGQFRRDQRTGMDVSVPGGRWAFSTQNQSLQLTTRGGGLPGAAPSFATGTGFGIVINPTLPPTVANCAGNSPNLLVAVYDQRTLRSKNRLPGADTCGQVPQQFYIFGRNPANAADTLDNLNNSLIRQTQLANFLAAVPEGSYVAIVSMNRLRWTALPAVRAALSTLLGSQLVNQLQNGDPFTIVAQKRAAGGRVVRELGPDAALATPARYNQIITLRDTLRTPTTRGTIVSTRIGPAKSWESLYHWIQRAPGATSTYTLKLVGIDALGRATVLNPNVAAATGRTGLPLAGYSATQYPYMQLEVAMQDSLNRQAPQLRGWFITYQGVPEGVVRRDLVSPATAYDPATLTAQAATGVLTIPVTFENVTPFDFAPGLRASIELRDRTTGAVKGSAIVTVPGQLRGESSVTFPAVLTGINDTGPAFTAKVVVNPPPQPQPELYSFNNELNLAPFNIIDNNVPPTLDVAVDGRHILNGELVSSQPVITVQLSDESIVRRITDPSFFTLTLQGPGQPTTPVNLTGANVSFAVDNTRGSVATINFQPGQAAPLPDGMYTLRVQGRDPNNSSAGPTEFQLKFEVVRAATITNVYPYPNPMVNKTQFVFTVTGHELPRDMKIQIMTLTGRVVREIFMSELGPLHIGNNLTPYAWDGTDTYGDRLANGTYLYRVALNDPDGQFSHRDSAGDKAFKNDWGKLVLMR